METSAISRVNYFSGEALLTADFRCEQKYHIDMRERLSRGLLSPGILSGLDVEWVFDSESVTVRAGEALDVEGRLIVLAQDTVVPLSGLVDGTQNFLTISYAEQATEYESTTYGDGYKRWIEAPGIICSAEYDPTGSDVLLAVISAQGGEIQRVYYFYGNYKRQRVSAMVQSVEFFDGADDSTNPPPMSIGAVGNGKLEVVAPQIELKGEVKAGSVGSAFEGTFTGAFVGDGAGLTNVPFPNDTGYWKRNESDKALFYTEGNVGVNVTEPTALLTVGQAVLQEIGTGLVTAISSEKGIVTLQGYQTNFTPDLVGKILQFGVVLEQEAMIASVDSDDSLTLSKSFSLGLGPTSYGFKSGDSGVVTVGHGTITPDGITVQGTGTQFITQLKAGDTLVIDRFVPDSKVHESKIDTVTTDTALTLTEAFSEDVTDSGYMYSIEAGRWITGAGTISSKDKDVTGTGTSFKTLPQGATLRAMLALEVASVPQTWRVDAVADATHLTMRKISIDDGSPVVPMMSAFAITTWPLMTVGSGEGPHVPPALTVVQNYGTVPNTVAINVDDETVRINSAYALQVNGPVSLTSLDVDKNLTVDGDLTVDGNLKVTGTAEIERMLTATGGLAVTGGATTDTLSVTGNNGTALNVAGKASIATLDVTSTTEPAATVTSLRVTDTNGTGLTVSGSAKINALEVTSTTIDPALKVDGTLTTDGALTVGKPAAKADATINGTLTVTDGIVGKLIGATNGGVVTMLHFDRISGANWSIISFYDSPADENGILTFTTDIPCGGVGVGGGWFSYCFTIVVGTGGAAQQLYANAVQTSDFRGGGGPWANACVTVPVNKGDNILIKYQNNGVDAGGAFSGYLRLFSTK
jgi:hypothetical protein